MSGAMRVLHLIPGLGSGGAEMMLCKLVAGGDSSKVRHLVVSMTDTGYLGDRFAPGTMAALYSRGKLPGPSGVFRFWRILKEYRPHLIQSWLYRADLFAALIRALPGAPPIAWNIRCTYDRALPSWWAQKAGIKALAGLSAVPMAVVVNSFAGKRLHEEVGYRPRRWEVIPNGFDTSKFRFSPQNRRKWREALGVPESSPFIGMVGRFDPMKDHANFAQAAARLRLRFPDARFLLAGKGVEASNPVLREQLGDLAGAFSLLGERGDVHEVLSALDLFSLSSAYGEGFPNVVGEAMACSLPCVATDVGDARVIIGEEAGLVVPPRDPAALAGAWERVLGQGEGVLRGMGERARLRVEGHFSLPAVVDRYERFYLGLREERATS